MESEGLVAWAKNEIKLAGIDQEDADYNGMLAKAVMELVETFSSQGHSGHSAMMVSAMFYRLAQYKPLTDLSNNPDEWLDVTENMYPKEKIEAGEKIWQSKRDYSVFSYDGGKTWENLGTKEKGTSIDKEELYGVKHINESEQEAPASTRASKGSGKAKDDGGVSTESSPEPEAKKASSTGKKSKRLVGSESKVEGTEHPDSEEKR